MLAILLLYEGFTDKIQHKHQKNILFHEMHINKAASKSALKAYIKYFLLDWNLQ